MPGCTDSFTYMSLLALTTAFDVAITIFLPQQKRSLVESQDGPASHSHPDQLGSFPSKAGLTPAESLEHFFWVTHFSLY